MFGQTDRVGGDRLEGVDRRRDCGDGRNWNKITRRMIQREAAWLDVRRDWRESFEDSLLSAEDLAKGKDDHLSRPRGS